MNRASRRHSLELVFQAQWRRRHDNHWIISWQLHRESDYETALTNVRFAGKVTAINRK